MRVSLLTRFVSSATVVSLLTATASVVGAQAAGPTAPVAQLARDSTVVVALAAPIFVLPDDTRVPLRVAKEGTVLRVVGVDGEWYNVEFDDRIVAGAWGTFSKSI